MLYTAQRTYRRVRTPYSLCFVRSTFAPRPAGIRSSIDHSHHHERNELVGAESIEGSAMAHYMYNLRA